MAGDSVRPLAATDAGIPSTMTQGEAVGVGRLAGIVAAAAAVVLVGGIVAGQPRAWAGWLLASFGLTTAGLAGIVFVATQYAAGASWSVAFRRLPEALAAVLPVGAVAIVSLAALATSGYPWASHHEFHGGAAAQFKALWLSRPFFAVRAIAYVLVWIVFARAIVANSRRQDAQGGPEYSSRNTRLSIAFLWAFAVTFSLASFDWIMSLEPEWYSTIFAMYNFAGLFSSGLAIVVLLAVWLRSGPLATVIGDDHLHDLGKLLFAFCTFWMYIWFSQYMLIWYAHIPEETTYYVARTRGAYEPLFVANVILNWVVPFFALLRRGPKRRPSLIARVAVAVLVGRWLDLYLMIVPPFAPDGPPFAVWEVAGALALVGSAVWAIERGLRAAALVPACDPRLGESLHYHV